LIFFKGGLFLCSEFLTNPKFNTKNLFGFLVKELHSIDVNRFIDLTDSATQLRDQLREERVEDVSSLEFYFDSKAHLSLYRKAKISINFIDFLSNNLFDFDSLLLLFNMIFVRNSNRIITGLFVKWNKFLMNQFRFVCFFFSLLFKIYMTACLISRWTQHK
jgi:hypothetical protein